MEKIADKRILIVDDDEEIRQALSIKLKKRGYIILEANNGNVGLEKLTSEKPDMVMVDVHMPGIDGFEFCEHASRLNSKKHIPIMIMTAHDDQESVHKAYEKGATDFITKPINYAKLEHRIRFSLRASETAERLASRERQLVAAQKAAKMGEWFYDINKSEFHCSNEVANIFGVSEQNVFYYDDLMKYVVGKDVNKIQDLLENAGTNKHENQIEYSIKTAGGENKRIRLIIDVNTNSTESDGNKVFGIFQDVTDLRFAEEQIKTLSLFDGLTGLPNRQFFKRILSKTIASSKRYERRFALLDINFDKFMRINTNLGHDVGDKLLIAASQRLNQAIRESDELASNHDREVYSSGLLAYFGSDNFIILLNDIKTAEDAAAVASRIKHMFEQPFDILNHEIRMTVSIGISLYPDDAGNADDLLKMVTIALHNAKETGRNCCRFYTETMNMLSFQRMSLETSLHKALERHEFVLHFQPKISLKDNSITGAEALIRWNHPDMGMVSPADFIPIAESSGLIVPMTDWVIMDVCRQLGEWRKKGLHLESVAINVTPASLLDKNINEHVFKNLQLAGMEASKLDFEITESVLMEDVDVILPILQELRDFGVCISIDDFGTGYSSLSYLKRLPISKLKIDQSFMRDLLYDKDDAVIVNAVIIMAHNLGLRVIAEGVEEQDQLEYLKEQGCDVVQGFYYSRPLAADDFYQWAIDYEASIRDITSVKLAG